MKRKLAKIGAAALALFAFWAFCNYQYSLTGEAELAFNQISGLTLLAVVTVWLAWRND